MILRRLLNLLIFLLYPAVLNWNILLLRTHVSECSLLVLKRSAVLYVVSFDVRTRQVTLRVLRIFWVFWRPLA